MPPLVIAAVVVGGAAIAGSVITAQAQSRASRRALATAASVEFDRLEFAKEQFAEGKSLREAIIESGTKTVPEFTEASLESLRLLREDANREPGTSEFFKTGLRRKNKEIFSSLAAFGLTDSSVAGTAVAESTEGLLANEFANIRGLRKGLVNLAPRGTGNTGVASSSNLANQATQAGLFMAGLQERNVYNPYGSFLSDFARVGTSVGLQYATQTGLFAK